MSQELRGKMGNAVVATYVINGHTIDVVGCWDKETPAGEYDFYDLYAGGDCLNLGDPWFPDEWDASPTTPPSERAVAEVLEEYARQGMELFA